MRARFADFELDTQRFSLQRNGQRLPLRPKVFDLLIYLVERRERVVAREELVAWLWGGTVVGAGSLSGLVNELRKALGERGHGESSIRTVHARGYQFVADVVAAHDSAERKTMRDPTGTSFRAPDAFDRPAETQSGYRAARAIFEARGFEDPPEELIGELCRFVAELEQSVVHAGQERAATPRAVRLDRPSRRMRLARSDSTSPRTQQRHE